jgi:hypothetical protein
MTPGNALYQLFKSDYLRPDPGDAATINVDRQLSMFPLVSGASGETRTLARPTKAGMIATVLLDTDGGGDVTMTVTGGYNADADTSIVLGDAGDFVTFLSVKIGAYFYWRVLAQEGTTAAVEVLAVDTLTVGGTAIAPADMTAGTGITTGTGTIIDHSVVKIGTLFKTTIVIDLTGLNSGNADGDIIGKAATANSHIGQITAAVNGTIFAGQMTCLEAATGGEPDIDIYSATVATGTEDTAIGDLVETALLNAAADWTLGMVKGLSAYPAANEYLYLVASGGATDATYTAGIFLIELWGQ